MSKERAFEALTLWANSVAKHRAAWRLHQERCVAHLSEIVTTGKYPIERCVGDLVASTLESCSLVHECYCPTAPIVPHSQSYIVPGGTVLVETDGLEFDQRSEMAGPARFPPLDEPSPAVPSRIPATTTGGSNGLSERTFARVLGNGEAWVSVINLGPIAPGIAVGTYPVEVAGQTVSEQRVRREDGKVLFQVGTLPPELLNDPTLELGELV